MNEEQVTKQDLELRKRQCRSPKCKHKAFIEDWKGLKWCLYHWYSSYRWGGGKTGLIPFLREIKTIKIF